MRMMLRNESWMERSPRRVAGERTRRGRWLVTIGGQEMATGWKAGESSSTFEGIVKCEPTPRIGVSRQDRRAGFLSADASGAGRESFWTVTQPVFGCGLSIAKWVKSPSCAIQMTAPWAIPAPANRCSRRRNQVNAVWSLRCVVASIRPSGVHFSRQVVSSSASTTFIHRPLFGGVESRPT